MDNQALKYEIIEWSTRTNNTSLLEALKTIKDSNVGIQGDWFDDLSDEENASLNRGMENHRKGEVLTSKEFWSDNGD